MNRSLPLSSHSPLPVQQPRAAFLLDPGTAGDIFSVRERADLVQSVALSTDFVSAADWRRHRAQLADCEIVLAGWGAPAFDEELLEAMPRLRAVFYAGGTVKKLVSDAFWMRNITLSACNAANAVPVAEFTLAQIIMLLKDVYRFAAEVKQARTWVPWRPVAGAYGSTVGLVSLSTIGRVVAQKLRTMDVRVIAYDPIASEDDFAACGACAVSLAEVFAQSHVVSLHAPLLPETTGIIDETLLRSMQHGAGFINTSRGAIVDQEALTRVFTERSDLFAMIDVAWPQPPPAESSLYDLPNVVITPHIAGSMSTECRRMGRLAIEELQRFLQGIPLLHQVTRESLRHSA